MKVSDMCGEEVIRRINEKYKNWKLVRWVYVLTSIWLAVVIFISDSLWPTFFPEISSAYVSVFLGVCVGHVWVNWKGEEALLLSRRLLDVEGDRHSVGID